MTLKVTSQFVNYMRFIIRSFFNWPNVAKFNNLHIYIQQLYLCSTRYIHIQHFIFIFNNAHFPSTSTKTIFIQQQYLFNFNCHIYSILSKNNCSTFLTKKHDFFVGKVPGHCQFLHSTKYPVPPHRPIPNMGALTKSGSDRITKTGTRSDQINETWIGFRPIEKTPS